MFNESVEHISYIFPLSINAAGGVARVLSEGPCAGSAKGRTCVTAPLGTPVLLRKNTFGAAGKSSFFSTSFLM